MPTEFKDLIRAEPGASEIYEVALEDRNKMAQHIQSYCTRTGAKLKFESINGFTMKHEPVYLLKVTVVESGKPRAKRGRPTKEVH